MKRIFISFAFIIAVLIFCSVETGYITAKADTFNGKIKLADNLMKANNYDNAVKLCEQIEDDWEKSTRLIDIFLIHDYVDNISISVSKLTVYARQKNTDMFFSESTQAKKQLASIKESEYPLIENLL